MTSPMFNPQPNYSGVTIQISNPAVNVGGNCGVNCQNAARNPYINSGYVNTYNNPADQNRIPQNGNYISYPQGSYSPMALPSANVSAQENGVNYPVPNSEYGVTDPMQNQGFAHSYPAQYYINNYNSGKKDDANSGIQTENGYSNGFDEHGFANTNAPIGNKTGNLIDNYNNPNNAAQQFDQSITNQNGNANTEQEYQMNSYKMYADKNEPKDSDMTRSKNIIGDLDERAAEIEEEKKNTKETKIVALTDEYIKSLENYLNNPNDEIRLMASKEVLTRLDEDKDRYNDAALNALLNKMMQDPNKLVRIASLSAFASQLASGNDYTVQLLHNIQSNPNSDKEDVLQAADILLKMSAGVEVKNIPNPSAKENNNNQKA